MNLRVKLMRVLGKGVTATSFLILLFRNVTFHLNLNGAVLTMGKVSSDCMFCIFSAGTSAGSAHTEHLLRCKVLRTETFSESSL